MFNIFKKRKKINKSNKIRSKITLLSNGSIEDAIDPYLRSRKEKIKQILLKINIKQHYKTLPSFINTSDIEQTSVKNNDIVTIVPIENNVHDYYFINNNGYIIPNNKHIKDYLFKKNIRRHIRYFQLCIINNEIKIINGSKAFNLKSNKTYHLKILNHNINGHIYNEYIFTDININTNYKLIKCEEIEKIYKNNHIFSNLIQVEKDFKAINLDFNIIKKLKNKIRKNKMRKIIEYN
jgi:hypothetical protein